MELVPDQVAGVDWILSALRKQKGCILADKMGLGKTAQAIEIMKRLCIAKDDAKILIICPAYLRLNWMEELELWGAARDHVCLIDSGKQKLDTVPCYVVSYSMVSGAVFDQLMGISWDLIICDEAHYLKSWGSTRSKNILGTFKQTKKTLMAKSKKFLLLTGTPIMNRIDEIYNLVIRVAPKSLDHMAKNEFIHAYAAHIEYTPWGIKHHGVKNAEDLRRRLADVVLCRTKIDGLPDRLDKTIHLSVDKAEIKKLIAEENKFLAAHGVNTDKIESDLQISRMEMDKLAEVRQRVALLKIPALLEAVPTYLDMDGGLVIYCYHRAVLAALVARLREIENSAQIARLRGTEKNIVIEQIHGGTPMNERDRIVRGFQAGTIRIICATIGALREGVNLTAGGVVAFLEYDWTPANMEQAIGRLHRRGQTRAVNVVFFAFAGGVDLYMDRALKRKRADIKKVMAG